MTVFLKYEYFFVSDSPRLTQIRPPAPGGGPRGPPAGAPEEFFSQNPSAVGGFFSPPPHPTPPVGSTLQCTVYTNITVLAKSYYGNGLPLAA